jgi:hypothetical protein
MISVKRSESVPVTYTNRKGITYYLCQGTTKTGKPRYYFARQPKGELVAEIPTGFKISESVNGRVSLVKDRPMQLFPEEIAAVEVAVRRHPRARNYRISVKHDCMEIYEQVGLGADDLIAALAQQGLGNRDLADRIRAERERYAQFTPVLRFILADAKRRTFRARRTSYFDDDWIDVGKMGSIERLAGRLIPKLGTDQFFELS